MSEQRRFSNALRILRSMDRDEVPFLSDDQWTRFVANPHDFYVRAGDEIENQLWAVITARQPERLKA